MDIKEFVGTEGGSDLRNFFCVHPSHIGQSLSIRIQIRFPEENVGSIAKD
jgi:hypothetical protein